MTTENTTARKRRFYEKKTFWIACVAIIAALGAGRDVPADDDKPLTILPVDSVDAEPDYAHGIGIDYRRRFELRQEANILPADENGWKLILQALGPLALEQKALATRKPWDQIATNDWFVDYWTPICEKFGIDPSTPPTFLTRLDLYEYLVKNGITGDEPEPSDSESAEGNRRYWENYEEKTGRVDWELAGKCYQTVMGKPWTKDDYPVAARWLEENEDLYEVFAKAVRSPRFACWRIVSEGPDDWVGMLLPDVQFSREIARKFQIRANYRIGTGDYSGAIDDVESIVLLAKSFFVNRENRCMVEALVGMAIMSIGAGISLDGGASGVEPTSEDYARLTDVWCDSFGTMDFEEAARDVLKGERDNFFLPTAQELPALARKGSLNEFLDQLSEDASEDSDESEKNDAFVWSGSFDDGAFMTELEKLWDELVVERKIDVEEWETSYQPETQEGKLAKRLFLLMAPAADAFGKANERLSCVVNMKLTTRALLSYQAEHGTLPPAFTVDENGKPLHSWRVLILPYLGEENKALYEQIRLDEPWDSDYNKRFHARAPKFFQCPSNKKREEGSTTYSVILGENALFDASGVGKDLAELRRREGVDTNAQALVVERERPICWMRPDEELEARSFRENAVALSEEPDCGHRWGVNVGFADGSVHYFATREAKDSEFDRYVSGVPIPEDDE
ncbi:MAG: DUF1559 domain-containing protein [Thermoguttaceae bacterium]|nr:DUF1559 domain-containing protein [Thermoguttaceae bacterium]